MAQTTHTPGKYHFRCSDVGPKECKWEASGSSEAELMPKIEQHGREAHNMKIDESVRNRVRQNIRRAA